MKTKAVRLYGENDLRLEEFDLPAIKDDEILMKVVADSICMSSYKAAIQGAKHKRVPNDVAENPIIIGHEFCGEIVEVGEKYKGKYAAGQKVTIQPAIPNNGYDSPGYSYKYCGGDATYIILPAEVMENDCLLSYDGEGYFCGALSEPSSCVIGAYHANYHTTPGSYVHDMGITEGGNMALLAGAGPMGLGAVDYAIHCDRKPAMLIVTDIDDARLARAASILPPEEAAKNGVKLMYINTADKTAEDLIALTDGEGYNDVFCYAPVRPVVEMSDAILAKDGCLNFFAGPTNPAFSAEFNFYNVHYASTHIVGTSGGNTEDMKESLKMMEQGLINPAAMITHIGGLNAAVPTTLNLPNIKGGKKLIYTGIELDLAAIDDFARLGETDPMFAKLDEICKRHNGLWNAEAEKYLLANAKAI